MENNNSYVKKARKNSILSGIDSVSSQVALPTRGDVKGSFIEAGKDLVLGVVIGGFAGAILGRPAFLAGFGVSTFGYYRGSRIATALGLGMMASASYQLTSVNGTGANGLEGIKERVKAFTEDLKKRAFVDKLPFGKKPAATAPSTGTAGLGDTRYFISSGQDQFSGDPNMNVLENLERQIAQSSQKYAQVTGYEEVGSLDYAERIY